MRIDVGAAFSIVIGAIIAATGAASQTPNPLVFDSPEQLKQYGIGIRGIGTDDVKIHFPTRCYSYGDGGWDISISPDLLNAYKAIGFSRRSACMALVSGIRFNPETGKRLTTYIIVDRTVFKKGQEPDAGSLSDELPLSLPDCFKGALPYSDCTWNFDPISGKKLSAAQTAKFKAIGRRIETFLSDPKRKSAFKYPPDDDDPDSLTKGTIMLGPDYKVEAGKDSAATLYDYSDEFPKGYGYALYADGTAGPSFSPEVVKAALTGQKVPAQIDPAKLMQIWRAGN